MHRCAIVILILLTIAAIAPAAPVRDGAVEVELISATTAAVPGETLTVGLRMRFDKKWHTYWRYTGIGYGATLDWKLPEGYSAGDFSWPVPKRYITELDPEFQFVNYVYYDEVLLVLDIQVPESAIPGTGLKLAASGDWLVCLEECLPAGTDLTLNLPIAQSAAPHPTWGAEFSAVRKKLPEPQGAWQVHAVRKGDMFQIRIVKPELSTADPAKVAFYADAEDQIDDVAPQPFEKKGRVWMLTVPAAPDTVPAELTGILVFDETTGVEVKIPVGDKFPESIGVAADVDADDDEMAEAGSGLFVVLLGAFFGGLILNLMPCVLPVLSIKILGFVEQAGEDKAKIKMHGLVFAAGVVVSFWVVAVIWLGLQAAGTAVGWGFQMQNPPFVAIMAMFLFLFGLNLFGVFEIGATLTAAGGKVKSSGLRGTFVTGVIATVVATPCSAPFMGTALFAASTMSRAAGFLIFTALALGLSSPYIVLAFFPKFIRFLPRPGAWMLRFKQFMGFLLMGSVIWLVFVYGGITGQFGITVLLGGLLLAAIGVWVFGAWATVSNSGGSRLMARLAAALLVAAGLVGSIQLAPARVVESETDPAAAKKHIAWEQFSTTRLEAELAAGRPIFIDFTADWCWICKTNEASSLRGDVAERMSQLDVVPLKADFTARSPEIVAALKVYKRNSVPTYVLYVPGKDAPIILPNLLTPGIVLKALDKIERE
jgi:thiol:disulfide interchange protein DsbD